jgi:hypothetical protein
MNDLSVFAQNLPAERNDDAAFLAVAKSGDWLPRIQLYGANSKEVKAARIPMANYGLVRGKDNIEVLGPTFDVVIADWRPKAMRIGAEGIDSYHDPVDPQFAKAVADSEIEDSGCMYGPEFLCWLPLNKTFATFFFNNPTMRRESGNMRTLIGKAATVKARLIENKRYSWHGPVVTPCSTPIANLPTPELVAKELDRFKNPKKSDVETVAPATERAR